ncbi:MAG: dephospho-CoA kinase [Planctomycetota bacterium]|nr:dephospho-CoA kinase [Planctomycetota bacterium]
MRPPVIGIVGGIGAGKSEVARAFAALGCVCFDSDHIAHEILQTPEVIALIRDRWGDTVLDSAVTPDRKAIAQIVFQSLSDRQWLESVIHPRLESQRRSLFSQSKSAAAHVIDAPLLLEAGLGSQCDAIVFVDSPPETRFARVQAARGWSETQWRTREAAQWPLDRKRAMSHHMVCNDGDPTALQASVRAVLERIRETVGDC